MRFICCLILLSLLLYYLLSNDFSDSRMKVNHISFQANWTKENIHLRPTSFDKFKSVVFYPLLSIARSNILLTTKYDKKTVEDFRKKHFTLWHQPIAHCNNPLRETFEAFPVEITTPDGCKLVATFYKHKQLSRNSPLTIVHQPNATLAKEGVYDWLLTESQLRNAPMNFLAFDYRGCGESKGRADFAKNLIMDAESVYQFATIYLGVSKNDVHHFGYSLGGGVSAELKRLHPDNTGKYISDRSFSSIKRTVQCHAGKILARLVKLLGWDLNAKVSFPFVNNYRTMVLFHPDDPVIPYSASLAEAANKKKISKKFLVIDLKRNYRSPNWNPHGIPLREFKDSKGNTAADAIAGFLLTTRT